MTMEVLYRFRLVRIFPLMFFLLDSCIDPLAVKVPVNENTLVVDGLITDQQGPYQVKLFYSSKLDTISIMKPRFETGAQVWVSDDTGFQESLLEVAPGIYQTQTMQGAVGKSYSLRILTKKNVEYVSDASLLTPAGTIDRIYVEYDPQGILLKGTTWSESFSVNVDSRAPTEGSNLLRWRWTGTYKSKTFPELRKMYLKNGPVPDPEPCSGYVRNGAGISKVHDCTCCICWATENSAAAHVSDNRFTADRQYPGVVLAKLPITGYRFYEKYYIEVQQLSVSEAEYEFWKLAEAQQRSAGSLFQPNSVRVRGNVKCVSDPTQQVLGVFGVSGVTTQSLFIDRSDVPLPIPPLDTIPSNCMEGLLGGGTVIKPDFW